MKKLNENFLTLLVALILTITFTVGCGDNDGTGPPGGADSGVPVTDTFKVPTCVQPPCVKPGEDGGTLPPDQLVSKKDTDVPTPDKGCDKSKLPKKCGNHVCGDPTYYETCYLVTCGGSPSVHVDNCEF